MHTQEESNEVLLAEIAKKIKTLTKAKEDLEELAGDLSDYNDKYAIQDFCAAVENALADIVSYSVS